MEQLICSENGAVPRLPDGRLLVLASSSPYRRELLDRLDLPFATCSPQVDEASRDGELPRQQVQRLAIAKAAAIADGMSDALVIGADQLASCDGSTMGKPGSFETARRQLRAMSNQVVTFHTGLCLLDAASGRSQSDVVPFQVCFRRLRQAAVDRYLRREQPFDCAGSFRSEGLGITLFEWLRGDDPNALIGLPLIRLVSMLAQEGIELP